VKIDEKQTPGISYRDLLRILAMHMSHTHYSGLRYLEYSQKIEREILLKQLNEEIAANTINAWAKGFLARKQFSEVIQVAKKKLIDDELLMVKNKIKIKGNTSLLVTTSSASLEYEEPLSPLSPLSPLLPVPLVENRTANYDELHEELNTVNEKAIFLSETSSLNQVFLEILKNISTVKSEEIQEDEK